MNATSKIPFRFFSWRTLRWILTGLVGLVTLVALLFAEENWRGKRAWDKFRHEWEAKGENFDLKSSTPNIPDDQNFAAIPLFQTQGSNVFFQIYIPNKSPKNEPHLGSWLKGTKTRLEDWQAYYRSSENAGAFPVAPQIQSPAQDVLFALQTNEPVLQMLRNAATRPYARYPDTDDTDASMSLLAKMKRCSLVFQLHSSAGLELDKTDAALSDVQLSLRLTDSLKSKPLVITELVRYAMMTISIQPIWEGLANHKWSDPQLATLDQELSKIDFIDDFQNALRGEWLFAMKYYECLRQNINYGTEGTLGEPTPAQKAFFFAPNGFLYQNEIASGKILFNKVLPSVDSKRRVISPTKIRELDLEGKQGHATPYNILARMSAAAFSRVPEKCARVQTSIDLTRTACALERYRLANGGYPEKLEALEPKWITQLPHDVINGQPLKYHRTDDGRFMLYSVGWNEADDNGTPAPYSGKGAEKGDWVWPWPVDGK